MLKDRKYYWWLLLAIAFCPALSAQEPGSDVALSVLADSTSIADTFTHGNDYFVVRAILIEGNKRTRPEFILRELPFKSGDGYLLSDLVKKFETGRRQLMNTALFHEVIVSLKRSEGYEVDVQVQVKERWYIFPIPYFKPVDRNLNQWLIEQKASLKRVNYGIKLMYNNVTGRNDKLRFWLISGYTRQFSFSYDRLYFDKQMKWGFNTGFNMGKNREMNYNTVDGKQLFFSSDDYIRKFMSGYAELTYRRAIRTRHRFGFAYTREDVADTVLKLNPDYFHSGRRRIEYPEVYYTMSYYDLDYIPYPTKGFAAEINLVKKGINKAMNLWQLSLKGSGNWPVSEKTFFSLNAFGTVKLPFKQAYYNRRLLGYSDVFIQGYEYYVIDGAAGGYLKAALTRKLFNFDLRIPGTKNLAPRRVPFNIYGKIFGNTGYVYNPYPGDRFLANQMLYSAGFGLDITTIYDFTMKIEWSFNQIGQNGLFLHRKSVF